MHEQPVGNEEGFSAAIANWGKLVYISTRLVNVLP